MVSPKISIERKVGEEEKEEEEKTPLKNYLF